MNSIAFGFFNALAAATIVSWLGFSGAGVAGVSAGPSASVHAVSAGRISVAIWPGATRAAWMASAPSPATVFEVGEVFTQCENGRAMPSMSAVSGVSYLM